MKAARDVWAQTVTHAQRKLPEVPSGAVQVKDSISSSLNRNLSVIIGDPIVRHVPAVGAEWVTKIVANKGGTAGNPIPVPYVGWEFFV